MRLMLCPNEQNDPVRMRALCQHKDKIAWLPINDNLSKLAKFKVCANTSHNPLFSSSFTFVLLFQVRPSQCSALAALGGGGRARRFQCNSKFWSSCSPLCCRQVKSLSSFQFLKYFPYRGCLDCVRLLTDSSSQFR